MLKKNYKKLRKQMVETQLRAQGIENEKVLHAMNQVQREKFVPDDLADMAYEDGPLAIGYNQTISQPYIVAYMIQALELSSQDKVLEIGTGSGYNAAVMSGLAKDIFTIEIVEPLGIKAKSLFEKLDYKNIHVQIGDGFKGWPEQAPFDAIILTAAPAEIPQPLIDQLAEDGRMVVPVGESSQRLLLITKVGGEIKRTELLAVRFVPMTGEAQRPYPR